MQFGIIGSGSWATALAKILTDNRHAIQWWVRNDATIAHLQQRRHNPHYLHSAYFDTSLLHLNSNLQDVIAQSDVLIVAVPSAYVQDAFSSLPADIFKNKKIVSAIKGILPGCNYLLNEYLEKQFAFNIQDYFCVLGPCHAEEVSAEKLSYLTFSGLDEQLTRTIASHFNTAYLNTIVNNDVMGVQYAGVLKNIYALGAGIAHGLEYGDNFLSVYIANSANEMVHFLQEHTSMLNGDVAQHNAINYSASVYLGDLLVTCYSLYSRNRMFGNMIGKGYSVKAAQLELNMVAEGYQASKCIYLANEKVKADIPVVTAVYKILWEHAPAHEVFKAAIEPILF
jgi:glycerol-3-phosphate dehydrogenase (NAD(P)+)